MAPSRTKNKRQWSSSTLVYCERTVRPATDSEWTCVEHDTVSVKRIIIAHSRPRPSISQFHEFKKRASKIDVSEFAGYRISWVLAIYRLCDSPPTSIFGARFLGSKSKPSQCHAVPARAGPNSRVRLIFHTEPIYPRLMCSNFDVSI